MRLFAIVILIGICLLVTFGVVFSSAMFTAVSIEGGSTHESEGVTQFGIINAWTIVISALAIIAVIVLALKLLRDSPS